MSVAWIQAIGSIIAILVAIWIGHRNHKHSVRVFEKSRCRDDADRRMKARSLALAIFPELMELKAKVAGAWHGEKVRFHSLDISPVLIESVNRLYLLDEAGAEIQQLVATSRQLNRMVKSIVDMKRTNTREEITEAKAKLRSHLRAIGVALDQAIELIGSIHDLPN